MAITSLFIVLGSRRLHSLQKELRNTDKECDVITRLSTLRALRTGDHFCGPELDTLKRFGFPRGRFVKGRGDHRSGSQVFVVS